MKTLTEGPRGCGFRKPGGLYLVTDPGPWASCERLPQECSTCPTCGQGIKPARGWTWVDPVQLFKDKPCARSQQMNRVQCGACPLASDVLSAMGPAGLLWVGGSFYPTPEAWMSEAVRLGVSRKVKAVPKGFELGSTWVLVGHREAIRKTCEECRGTGKELPEEDAVDGPGVQEEPCQCSWCGGMGWAPRPGIFQVFKPTRVEYVTTGKETDEELGRMERRGITPVKVVNTTMELDGIVEGDPLQWGEGERGLKLTEEGSRGVDGT